jgi:hypothetical protein
MIEAGLVSITADQDEYHRQRNQDGDEDGHLYPARYALAALGFLACVRRRPVTHLVLFLGGSILSTSLAQPSYEGCAATETPAEGNLHVLISWTWIARRGDHRGQRAQ